MTGIIVIDKDPDWTSHDVVAKLRGILKEKRVGHGGTLDPMATGVLPVFIGRATRAVPFCEAFDKEYIAGLRLGLVTDTQDITGSVLSALGGRRLQKTTRPMFCKTSYGAFSENRRSSRRCTRPSRSAATRLYELARRGVEAERKTPRAITDPLILSSSAGPDDDWLLRSNSAQRGRMSARSVTTSASQLGCGGTMCSLRRTRAGSFSRWTTAVTLSDVETAVRSGNTGRRCAQAG